MNERITLRPLKIEDTNFILKQWMRTYKYTGDAVRNINNEDYYPYQEQIIKGLLDTATTTIACLTEDPDVIIGFSVITEGIHPIIHFVLIKDVWRGMKISLMLLKSVINCEKVYFTHWTRCLNQFINKYPQLIYNPYLLNQSEHQLWKHQKS